MKRCRGRHPQISLLVPFRPDPSSPERVRVWAWLKQYWQWEMPDAEIVMGASHGRVFSKAEAVNDAASKANGRIFVIIDSDTYIEGAVLQACATQIERAEHRGRRLWFCPYRHLYRLTWEATEKVLHSDPRHPHRFHSPPLDSEVNGTEGSAHGSRFGAMATVMSRRAFYEVGGMDPRFRGWGGEDVAFLRALDTLYQRHKTVDCDVLHLWHHRIGTGFTERMWDGQLTPQANGHLASRYNRATGDRVAMRALVDEGFAWWKARNSWLNRLWQNLPCFWRFRR